jgi:hypothetical protein
MSFDFPEAEEIHSTLLHLSYRQRQSEYFKAYDIPDQHLSQSSRWLSVYVFLGAL